jgi:hypothetical protein
MPLPVNCAAVDNLDIALRLGTATLMALSHCQTEHVAILMASWTHAAATTSCHVCIADVLKARCVLADVR